ncbi:MAG: KH domain-containing protein [Candidatus Peribacteraceae bacterium]|nr:KH domain-containing protein [Candidatus Peribacteraceae bacterium]
MTTPAPAAVPGYEFLKYVLESLVEDKDQLSIEPTVDDLGILLTVRVSDRDMGKLIGKSGQTVKALRTLLRIIGGANEQRVNLKILEPQQA